MPKPTVILVHGMTCDHSVWEYQIPALTADYGVIAPDLPADRDIELTTFSDTLDAALVSEPDPVVLVGHSMGGPVIRQYARLHPGRAAALVFVDAPFRFADTPEIRAWPESFAGPNGPANRRAFLESLFGPYISEDLKTRLRNLSLSTPEKLAVQSVAWMTDPAVMLPDDHFDCPALIVTPQSARAPSTKTTSRMFSSTTYAEIPETGHFLMLERPTEFNRLLLEFLREISASSAPPR